MLRTLIDDLAVEAFNVGIFNIDLEQIRSGSESDVPGVLSSKPWDEVLFGEPEEASAAELPPGDPPARFSRGPVIARLVSRGRMGMPASDFGCLEVIGGASIGHMDPYALMKAIDARLLGRQDP